MGSRVWPFGVTWHHRSRNHLTPGGEFLWVVHSDHASVLHRYGDMAPQRWWGHQFYLLGSRDVIGHMTIRLLGVDFLWVVHSDHASILQSYGDMTPQILDAQTWTQKERWKKGKRKRKGKGREGKRKGKWKAKKKGKGIGEGKEEEEKEGKGEGKGKVEER